MTLKVSCGARCLILSAAAMAFVAAPAGAQFDEIPVPDAMEAVEFMVGEWTVEGAFRTPDHVGTDRTLWYLTRGGGVTRFDGSTWVAYAPGDSVEADDVLEAVARRAEPYRFENEMVAVPAQDGFLLVVDEGRTSGTTLIYFDTSREMWVAQSIHAPTNSVTVSEARAVDGLPVFEGRATDRRGERIFRRRFEVHDANHYSIRTDVSFDEGTTWIDDQIVQEMRRR